MDNWGGPTLIRGSKSGYELTWRRHCFVLTSRAYSKRVPRTNCALRIKKCAPRITRGIYFLSTS